jgi:hypothetical protein
MAFNVCNDVSLVMRTMNWCKSHSDEQTMNDRGDQASDDEQQQPNIWTDESTLSNQHAAKRRPELASICIILDGPFTPRQKAICQMENKSAVSYFL